MKQIKKGLSILETKILYTNEPLPVIFYDIHKKIKGDVGVLFLNISRRMNFEFAGEAWEKCIDSTRIMINEEDKETLKSLGKMLGNTDVNGQMKQINLVNKFLDEQINEAVELKNKNEKMYKKLGIIIGLGVVVLLV